ncbi:AGAP002782-PA-like protein [Anopheles sinensis]|uniref:AGAP002782-PA-like protein n=1 Tax=Anopheles sinensis TaxID=74873 RepID=A0A084W355_ANOSI|nr:AGAP002782-PA-like protein [Anopheles sinensis]
MAEKSETLVTKEERINEAKELFGRGSRNYCMKQYAEAADDLSACCGIYSELYGPQADECGLPYLLYAKSLIALGKDENNLIVPGDDEAEADDDDDEEEEVEGEEESADGEENEPEGEVGGDKDDEAAPMDTNDEATEKSASKEEEEKPVEAAAAVKENGEAEQENVKQKEETAAEGPSSSTKDAQDDDPQPGPSTSNGASGSGQEEAEDAAGNLQVAWEILELAVKIFEEQGEKAYENLSECYSELAGISFENSHFQEAINDYTKAMEISKKTNKSDLRMLAEVHYKVGLCYLMINDYDSSVKSFHGAVGELDKVIDEVKAKEQTDETKETIEELEETKKEILEKIADVEDAKKTSIEEVKRELSKIIVSGEGESSNGLNNGAGTSSSSASTSANGATNGSGTSSAAPPKPANDISHLIKRKKPDSVTAEVEGSPAKKTASETDNVAAAAHNASA